MACSMYWWTSFPLFTLPEPNAIEGIYRVVRDACCKAFRRVPSFRRSVQYLGKACRFSWLSVAFSRGKTRGREYESQR
jgi:hypothetical protein